MTYLSSTPYGYEGEALSGIVQSLLITKHILFIGFLLTDDAFNQVVLPSATAPLHDPSGILSCLVVAVLFTMPSLR